MRGRYIFGKDLLCLQLDGGLERVARRQDGGLVGGVLRVHEPLVLLHGVFGVDGQPHRVLVVLARQANRKLDQLVAARHGLDVARKLVGREHVVDDGPKLHFAPGAARLHVGHHALQVTHAARQGLHFAQALVHLLQPVRHQLEGFAQALLQRGVQLFVHRAAHFFELGGVVGLNGAQTLVERGAQLFGVVLAALHQAGELLRHGVLQHRELVLDLVAVAFELVLERGRHGAQLALDVGLERVERDARGGRQRLETLLNALFKQRCALAHGLARLDALKGQGGRGGGELGAKTHQCGRQLGARGGGIGLALRQVGQQRLAAFFQAPGHGLLQTIEALGQRGVQRGLALGQGGVEHRQALLQPPLEHAKGRQQFGAAVARFTHRLGQAFVNGVAQGFERGLRGLCETAELVGQRIHGAIVLGHCQLGGLASLFQGLQPRQPLGRQVHTGAAHQQQHQKQQHQGQRGQQNKRVSSQGIHYYIYSILRLSHKR